MRPGQIELLCQIHLQLCSPQDVQQSIFLKKSAVVKLWNGLYKGSAWEEEEKKPSTALCIIQTHNRWITRDVLNHCALSAAPAGLQLSLN